MQGRRAWQSASANLALIVAQHERGLDHVSERGHLRVAEHQLEEREISEKVACLIPNLPERNLPMF